LLFTVSLLDVQHKNTVSVKTSRQVCLFLGIGHLTKLPLPLSG